MKWKLITDLIISSCATGRLLLKYLRVSGLQGSGFTPCSVKVIQLAESTLGPDAEASNVTTRGEPQEVQFVHILQSDAFIQENSNSGLMIWFDLNRNLK